MRKPNLRAAKQQLKEALRPFVRTLGHRRRDLPPSTWNLEVRDGLLLLEGHALHGLLSTWGSPLHVVHGAALARNVNAFATTSPGARARCEVFYSYKTNPVPGVLRALHARGVGAEVISAYELWLALRLGVPPEKIIYNGPAKSEASIEEAIGRGVLLLNANHREEIDAIAGVARRVGKRARVGVRVVTALGWAGQFGVPIAGGEAIAAYGAALAHPELEVVGLHSHIGRHIEDEALLRAFLDEVIAFLEELRQKLGLSPSIVDLGGSLEVPTIGPITSVAARLRTSKAARLLDGRALNQALHADLMPPDPSARLSIAGYARTIVDVMEAYAARAGIPVPRLCVEPGRALTGNTQLLLTSVMTTKVDRDGLTYAILDAGINVAESAKHEYHQLFSANRYGAPPARTYRLCGPICTPEDILYSAWDLPELAPGDSLAICDAGAYFVPFATSFSFPQPAIVVIEDGKVELLRRAETFEDLVALDTDR